ncbi:MAG: class I tRNA ligase family protein, partial [bacterium]|nr:class I tRNA ligase family protein [bacterium]
KFWDDNAGNRKEILKNGEVQELSYAPFPHNREWELDYHRPYVDDMRYPCACGGEMRRIEDVFDCWYESGSMPYGQFHYPFEDAKLFKQNFPADFIAEGLDQTRGWFYSLTVLGVALFGEIPFKHVIVNGIILAEDGQKMSKKLKNYPDPMELVDKYGADALRYYLLSSPVVRGEDINFSEKAVAEVSRKVIGRLMNVHSFYETYQSELASAESWKKTKNPLDIWILSRLAELRNGMTEGMERYELDAASRGIDKFVDDLSTWYLRRSRERFKGDDVKDREWALATTHRVLFDLSKLLAPFMPFIAEDLYQKVKGIKDKESVHLESWPEEIRVDKDLIDDMEEARRIVSSGLEARAKNNIKVRQPLLGIEVSTVRLSDKKSILSLIKDELNVKEITTKLIKEEGSGSFRLNLEITPELKKEGQLRDLTRTIQELRKEKKLTPRDRITLVIDGNEEGKDFVREFEAQLKKAVLADALKFEAGEGEEVEIGDLKLIIAIEK